MSEIRLVFVHQVVSLNKPVAQVCRDFGISRKTGYKWLNRFRNHPRQSMVDRQRIPLNSPNKTSLDIEEDVLEVRRRFGWGPRKIHAYLRDQMKREGLPSIRTVANILKRNGCIEKTKHQPAQTPQFFERPEPHQLWQCDFKGPLEIQRKDVHPFTVIDDHSRYLLALKPSTNCTMNFAFDTLWNVFGEVGLPQAILCDNAFGTTYGHLKKSVSRFEARLIRLGIQPIHGRPYHPQTQGKIERLHATLEREVWPFVRRDCLDHFDADINRWRIDVYNTLRPHEALGDQPPISRFRPSPRPRPPELPIVQYPPGSITRKVSTSGDVHFRRYRILAGRGLTGETVRIEERDTEILLFYASKEIRRLSIPQMTRGRML